MWTKGSTKHYEYGVKHYEEGSIFGINDGRISKLYITDIKTGELLVNYDRAWDIEPAGKALIDLYNDLLEKFN